jgi:hypothetical protein
VKTKKAPLQWRGFFNFTPHHCARSRPLNRRGIMQFAQHLPATLERHAAPAEFALGINDDQLGQ